jgi:hypothetical protein
MALSPLLRPVDASSHEKSLLVLSGMIKKQLFANGALSFTHVPRRIPSVGCSAGGKLSHRMAQLPNSHCSEESGVSACTETLIETPLAALWPMRVA